MTIMIAEHVPEFYPGQLAVTRVTGRLYSEDGWAMGGWHGEDANSLKVYEKISLDNFPSSNDFFGDSSIMTDGQIVIIVRSLGRPMGLSSRSPHSVYDVYEIMLDGVTRQVFRNNIEKILLPEDLNENNDN